MTPDLVRDVTTNGVYKLQNFNQNTIHLCHNMLRHLPKSKSAFAHVHNAPSHDRVFEIETFLLDQTEKLMELTKDKRVNKNYGIDILTIEYRSEVEKRFVSLLNHFIQYAKNHNKLVFSGLNVEYKDGTMGLWDKTKMDEVGGILKGNNPLKLYRFVKAVANSADQDNSLRFESPILKEPSKEMDLNKEVMSMAMTLLVNGKLELDHEISEEDFIELMAQLSLYADALKYKENSLKLRQETLISIFNGNPNGTVRDMILDTNSMAMELKNEQMILSDTISELNDFAFVHNYSSRTSSIFEQIANTMNTYKLKNDNKLNFIIRSEKLEQIMTNKPEANFELVSSVGH